MSKGKRSAAVLLHSECLQNEHPKQLHDVLDFILLPEHSLKHLDNIEWLKWLMAGGRTPDDFSATGKTSDTCFCHSK